jgi:hypothetical protein
LTKLEDSNSKRLTCRCQRNPKNTCNIYIYIYMVNKCILFIFFIRPHINVCNVQLITATYSDNIHRMIIRIYVHPFFHYLVGRKDFDVVVSRMCRHHLCFVWNTVYAIYQHRGSFMGPKKRCGQYPARGLRFEQHVDSSCTMNSS